MSHGSRYVVLVDGSNVAHSDAWTRIVQREQGEVPHANHHMDSDPRARLLDWILAWTTSSGADIVAVFDGEGPLGAGRTQWNHAFLVVGSGKVDGDRVVEQEAVRLRSEGLPFRLVTSDRALAEVAGAHAEQVLEAAAFVAALAEPPIEPSGPDAHTPQVHPTRLGDTVDAETMSALERLRRGHE